MLGILVFGDNHLIVEGPRPEEAQALALKRYWSVIAIGRVVPEELKAWRVVTKAFRENLEWAWVAPGDGEQTSAVRVLLDEMRARGVVVEEARV